MSTNGGAEGDGVGDGEATHAHAHSHDGVRHTHAHGHSAHAHDFAVPDLPEAVDIFDTILRDGSQQEGLSLTVDDKLRVAEQLDHLGVTFIEGGWPGANPKDVEFFARAKKELTLHTATLVAFGSTRRRPGQPGGRRRPDRLHCGQVVGPARRRGLAHIPRRGSGDGG
jgi:HMGL-like